MAQTLSDRHKAMYAKWRRQGLTHDQAMQLVPEKLRMQFSKDLQKSSIESHFGFKDKWFYLILFFAFIVVPAIILMTAKYTLKQQP